jgi:hypothetical protein
VILVQKKSPGIRIEVNSAGLFMILVGSDSKEKALASAWGRMLRVLFFFRL